MAGESVSLFLFCKFICIISFQIPHIRIVIQYFSFSVSLNSLSMTISRSIHSAANGIINNVFPLELIFIPDMRSKVKFFPPHLYIY